jgi:hypothetical protein
MAAVSSDHSIGRRAVSDIRKIDESMRIGPLGRCPVVVKRVAEKLGISEGSSEKHPSGAKAPIISLVLFGTT